MVNLNKENIKSDDTILKKVNTDFAYKILKALNKYSVPLSALDEDCKNKIVALYKDSTKEVKIGELVEKEKSTQYPVLLSALDMVITEFSFNYKKEHPFEKELLQADKILKEENGVLKYNEDFSHIIDKLQNIEFESALFSHEYRKPLGRILCDDELAMIDSNVNKRDEEIEEDLLNETDSNKDKKINGCDLEEAEPKEPDFDIEDKTEEISDEDFNEMIQQENHVEDSNSKAQEISPIELDDFLFEEPENCDEDIEEFERDYNEACKKEQEAHLIKSITGNFVIERTGKLELDESGKMLSEESVKRVQDVFIPEDFKLLKNTFVPDFNFKAFVDYVKANPDLYAELNRRFSEKNIHSEVKSEANTNNNIESQNEEQVVKEKSPFGSNESVEETNTEVTESNEDFIGPIPNAVEESSDEEIVTPVNSELENSEDISQPISNETDVESIPVLENEQEGVDFDLNESVNENIEEPINPIELNGFEIESEENNKKIESAEDLPFFKNRELKPMPNIASPFPETKRANIFANRENENDDISDKEESNTIKFFEDRKF